MFTARAVTSTKTFPCNGVKKEAPASFFIWSEKGTENSFPGGVAMNETEHLEKATLAGGCFWCMEPPFDALEGVISTMPGYAGGHLENPTYEQVCSGETGHTEVIQITYDKRKLSFEEILDVFWKQIDPTALNRQFADAGSQYRTAIFYHDDEQRRIAEASKQTLEQSGRFDKPIVTEITPLKAFYPAEDYHQKFYQHNPQRYKFYRANSGRDQFLDKVWGDEDKKPGEDKT
jgi:methionine-S-sulfoxide reductase